MRNDNLMAFILLIGVSLSIVAVMVLRQPDTEWYKYKVTVTEDNGVLLYGVETWDGVYLGEVPASKLDSLINDYNY